MDAARRWRWWFDKVVFYMCFETLKTYDNTWKMIGWYSFLLGGQLMKQLLEKLSAG